MLRKAIIVVLMLAAVATAITWADSYRCRKPRPVPPEIEELLERITVSYLPGLPDPLAGVGLSWDYYLRDREVFRVRTCRGTLNLRYDSGIKTGTPVPRKNSQFGGFRYKHWMWTSSIEWGQDGEPDIHDDYRVREISLPFAALFAVLASYPILAFIRGPLRRWRHRRAGLCLNCGYDLTGNESGICPECGRPL